MIPVDDFRQMISYDELTSDATMTLARIAAEAIRGLNRTTNCDAGLDQPAGAYHVPGARSQAAARLGQRTAQLTRYLGQALAAGKLSHDHGEDPARAVEGAVIFLGDARLSAAALAGDLDAAWQQLALINGRPAPCTPQDQP